MPGKLVVAGALTEKGYSSPTQTENIEAKGQDSVDEDAEDTESSQDASDGGDKKMPSSAEGTKKNAADCSSDSLNIVNGSFVKRDTLVYRSTVSIYYDKDPTNCTGTLIGPRHVLTAAHCLDEAPQENPIEVRFGLDRLKPDFKVQIDKFVRHPDWTDINDDVGIITLKTAVPSQYVPVSLAKLADLKAGTPVIIAGYGVASETAQASLNLSSIMVPLESTDKTNRYFSTVINGNSSCYGDSGGPGFLIDPVTQCLSLAGIVSIGSLKGNGECGQGDTMMNAVQYQGWFKAAFKAAGAPLDDLLDDGSEKTKKPMVVETP